VAPAGKIPYKEGQPIPPDYCNPLYTPTDSYAGEVDFGHNIIMRYELRKHNNILDLSGNMAIPWDNINAFRLKIVVAGSDCIAKKVYTQMAYRSNDFEFHFELPPIDDLHIAIQIKPIG
jgi:hypothetical protein